MAQSELRQRRRRAEAQASRASTLDSLESVRVRAAAVQDRAEGVARPRELAKAAVAWMSATFALCYLAVPTALTALGLRPWASVSPLEDSARMVGDLGGFALVVLGTLAGLALLRPSVKVQQAQRDPVVAATAGGLLTWGVLHNVLPWLLPFAEMGAAPLAAFVAANVLESLLFGLMLGSFVRSRAAAFALGAGFSAALLSLTSALTMLAWVAGF